MIAECKVQVGTRLQDWNVEGSNAECEVIAFKCFHPLSLCKENMSNVCVDECIANVVR